MKTEEVIIQIIGKLILVHYYPVEPVFHLYQKC